MSNGRIQSSRDLGVHSDWDVLVSAYAERHAVEELARSREVEKRRATETNAAIVGWYMGVLHRIRLMTYDRIEELKIQKRTAT